MAKKIICLSLLIALLVLAPVCFSAQAEETASGTFGREVMAMEWSVQGNTLYITGEGSMDGFSAQTEQPWYPYREQIQRVVMTGDITNVGYRVFEGCTALTEIVWPEGLKYIYDYAFRGCTSLKEVAIPDQVEILNEYAFADCTALETVTMSDSVQSLYEHCFHQCSSLRNVTLSSKLREIHRSCFLGCKALKQIELPQTLRRIGDDAFRESGLTEIVIPERVQELSLGVFWRCVDLEKVTFSKSSQITVLNTELFGGCKKLQTVHVPASVTSVQIDAFENCDNLEAVYFYGDMPEILRYISSYLCIDIYYPEGNVTWTQEKMDALAGGWLEVSFKPGVYQWPEEPAPEPIEPTPPPPVNPAEPTDTPNTPPPTEQAPAETQTPATSESTQETTGETTWETTQETTWEATGEGETATDSTLAETPSTAPNADTPKKTKSWPIVVLVAVIVVVADGVVGAVYIRRRKKENRQKGEKL